LHFFLLFSFLFSISSNRWKQWEENELCKGWPKQEFNSQFWNISRSIRAMKGISDIGHFLCDKDLSTPMEGQLLQIQNHKQFKCIETVHLDVLTFLSKIMFEIIEIRTIRKKSFFYLNQNFHKKENILLKFYFLYLFAVNLRKITLLFDF